MTKNKFIQFGENVEGYDIPVLNEREIRASAGILFLFIFLSVMFAAFQENFVPIKYFVSIFFTDFLIRVFINPKYSPLLILSRLIVKNQTPEYVGAAQKKFAWQVGLFLSFSMFILIVVLNTFSEITGIVCLICEIFLFAESAFGICIACKFYNWFHKDKAQYCPGEVCEIKDRQEIQKTSKLQIFILFTFIAYILIIIFLFNENFNIPTRYLWDVVGLI